MNEEGNITELTYFWSFKKNWSVTKKNRKERVDNKSILH